MIAELGARSVVCGRSFSLAAAPMLLTVCHTLETSPSWNVVKEPEFLSDLWISLRIRFNALKSPLQACF